MNTNNNPDSTENDVNLEAAGQEESSENLNADQVGSQSDASGSTDGWKEKYEDINDRYLRLYSEFDNFRKRTAKERIEFSKVASADIVTDLLTVLDDFDRAAKVMSEATEIEAIREGMQLIHHKMRNVLVSKGLEEMTSIGKEFDPELQEAITSIPAVESSQKGKVVDELEKGYLMNGKVIRFAKVIVGS